MLRRVYISSEDGCCWRFFRSRNFRKFRTERGASDGSASLGRWHKMQANAAIAPWQILWDLCPWSVIASALYMIVDKAALLRSYNHRSYSCSW